MPDDPALGESLKQKRAKAQNFQTTIARQYRYLAGGETPDESQNHRDIYEYLLRRSVNLGKKEKKQVVVLINSSLILIQQTFQIYQELELAVAKLVEARKQERLKAEQIEAKRIAPDLKETWREVFGSMPLIDYSVYFTNARRSLQKEADVAAAATTMTNEILNFVKQSNCPEWLKKVLKNYLDSLKNVEIKQQLSKKRNIGSRRTSTPFGIYSILSDLSGESIELYSLACDQSSIRHNDVTPMPTIPILMPRIPALNIRSIKETHTAFIRTIIRSVEELLFGQIVCMVKHRSRSEVLGGEPEGAETRGYDHLQTHSIGGWLAFLGNSGNKLFYEIKRGSFGACDWTLGRRHDSLKCFCERMEFVRSMILSYKIFDQRTVNRKFPVNYNSLTANSFLQKVDLIERSRLMELTKMLNPIITEIIETTLESIMKVPNVSLLRKNDKEHFKNSARSLLEMIYGTASTTLVLSYFNRFWEIKIKSEDLI